MSCVRCDSETELVWRKDFGCERAGLGLGEKGFLKVNYK